MSVIIRKEQARQKGWKFLPAKHAGGRSPIAPLAASVLAVAIAVVALGYVSAPSVEPPSPSTVKAAKLASKPPAKPAPAEASKAALRLEADRLTAALLAFKKDHGALPSALTELVPLYLSDTDSSTPGLVGSWALEGYTLKKPDVSEIACRTLNPKEILTPIDHGVTGLRCVSVEDKHTAFYRIDEAPAPLAGFWQLNLQADRDGKLVSWKVTSEARLVETCEHAATLNQTVVLDSSERSVSVSVCLPAYEQEVAQIGQGLNLLEGSASLHIPIVADEQQWTLSIEAQACNFGQRTLSRLSLKPGAHVSAPSALSCDLKPTV